MSCWVPTTFANARGYPTAQLVVWSRWQFAQGQWKTSSQHEWFPFGFVLKAMQHFGSTKSAKKNDAVFPGISSHWVTRRAGLAGPGVRASVERPGRGAVEANLHLSGLPKGGPPVESKPIGTVLKWPQNNVRNQKLGPFMVGSIPCSH